MNPAVKTPSAWANWHWPDEVWALAVQTGTEQYLEPYKDALARLWPTARRATVKLDVDPELRDERHITFDVQVPAEDLPDFIKGSHACHDELFRIVPMVKAWVFRTLLEPVD
jgi:hypothetical protein